MRLSPLVLALVAGLPLGAQAASPPDILLAGSVAPVLAMGRGWCSVELAQSTFLRNKNGTAKISFASIIYNTSGSYGPTGAYILSGQARFFFTSTTSGKVQFDADSAYPDAVWKPTFDSYSQSYDATRSTLTVKVKINFPECTLPIDATYHN